MSKRLPSLFFADNKDIYDHLRAYEVFKALKLRAIAASRGLVLSSRSPKESLAEYVSLLSFDRDQLDQLLDATEVGERQRPSTLRTFSFAADAASIQVAAETIKKARNELAEDVQVTTTTDGVVTVKLTYTELDSARNRLDQKVVRTAVVDLEEENGNIRIRSTPGRKAEAVIEDIVAQLWSEKEPEKPPPPPLKIDLSGVRNAHERTQFFYRLFKNISGFAERGVSDVRVSRLDDESATEQGDSDEDADSAPRFVREERQMKNALKAAVLEGVNLLQTPVYQQLQKQGYYLTRAAWRARDTRTSFEAEFEAWFHDAKNAADFRYRVKTVSELDGSGEQGPHVRPDGTQEQKLIRLLEHAAQKAYDLTEEAVSKGAVAAKTE
jgi:hypothetical protein